MISLLTGPNKIKKMRVHVRNNGIILKFFGKDLNNGPDFRSGAEKDIKWQKRPVVIFRGSHIRAEARSVSETSASSAVTVNGEQISSKAN